MTNVQLYLSIGIPTFTVILALLIALFQSGRLADKLDRVAERLTDKIDATNKEIVATNREIASTNREVASTNKEVASLNKEIAREMAMVRSEHHADFKMLMEQIVRLNERIAKVEG